MTDQILPTEVRVPTPLKGNVLNRVLGQDWGLAYVLLTPTAAIIIGLIAYPLLVAFTLAFQNKPLGGEGEFVGLQNFATLLSDPVFHRAALNSAVYTVVAVGGKLLIGLIAALVVHEAVRFHNIFRALLILPWATPIVVGAFTWRWMFDDGRGIFNYLLWNMHLVDQPVLWLSDPKIALWSIIIVVIWQGMPFYMLNILAGLSSIDKSLYEAASIDGAGSVQRFMHITLPGLSAVIAITVMLSTIWTAGNLNFVFILTRGGPGSATQIFPMLSYTQAILLGELGMGAAVALSFFPVLLPLVFLLTRMLLREES